MPPNLRRKLPKKILMKAARLREMMRKAEFEREHDAADKEDEAGLREMMRQTTSGRKSARTSMRTNEQNPRTQKY